MGKCAIAGRECPRTNNPSARSYCPAWSDGVVYRNDVTGAERVVNCSFEAMMPALTQVIAASNRPAAAVESVRNEMASGLANVARSVMALGPKLQAIEGRRLNESETLPPPIQSGSA